MKALIAAIVLATATPVFAQSNCGPLDAVNKQLNEKYGEQLRTIGTAKDGQVVISQYANEDTGSWTLLTINANGIACVVASGQNWSPVEPKNMDDPA